jgi:hypothetical protein
MNKQATATMAGVRRSRWRGESRRRRISNRKNESECRLDMQGMRYKIIRGVRWVVSCGVVGVDLLAL